MSDRILIVEDEDTLRESLCRVFEREGYEVAGVDSAEAALERLKETVFEIVITDIILPGKSGIELIKRVKEAVPDQPAVVMTAYASMETAVETLRAGAYDYIVKPIIHEEIKQTVRNALRLKALQLENEMLKNEAIAQEETHPIIGNHPQIRMLRNRLEPIAASQSPVWIMGELGTGKSLTARAIHLAGKPVKVPFVALDCASLTAEQMEAALFLPMGVLHRVYNGTLYLNRIEALSEHIHNRLLQAIQTHRLGFNGQSGSDRFDPLVVVGAEKSPEALLSEGQGVVPLYQYLSEVRIDLPPLRQRDDDVDMLAEYFLAEFNRRFAKQVSGITDEARHLLRACSWPGNVLELRNLMERAVLTTKNVRLTREDFSSLS